MATFQQRIDEALERGEPEGEQELYLVVCIHTFGKPYQAWIAARNLARREWADNQGLVSLLDANGSLKMEELELGD